MQVLKIRKLANTSDGQRVTRYDTITGQKYLADPVTSEAKCWPLAGIKIEGDVPTETCFSTALVGNGLIEGWIELENEQIVHRPGGPADDRWRVTHTFRHADFIVLKTVDGDLRYRVTHQPDKYVNNDNDEDIVTDDEYIAGNTRVDWFYHGKLED